MSQKVNKTLNYKIKSFVTKSFNTTLHKTPINLDLISAFFSPKAVINSAHKKAHILNQSFQYLFLVTIPNATTKKKKINRFCIFVWYVCS